MYPYMKGSISSGKYYKHSRCCQTLYTFTVATNKIHKYKMHITCHWPTPSEYPPAVVKQKCTPDHFQTQRGYPRPQSDTVSIFGRSQTVCIPRHSKNGQHKMLLPNHCQRNYVSLGVAKHTLYPLVIAKVYIPQALSNTVLISNLPFLQIPFVLSSSQPFLSPPVLGFPSLWE